MILAGQRHIVDDAHVKPDHAANGHRVGILAVNVHVLNSQVFHFAQAHADHTDTADRVV